LIAVPQRAVSALAASPGTSTPAELADLLKSEMAKWGPIIKELGIKAD